MTAPLPVGSCSDQGVKNVVSNYFWSNFGSGHVTQDNQILQHNPGQFVSQIFQICRSLAASGRLQNVIEYCIKVREKCPAGSKLSNSAVV